MKPRRRVWTWVMWGAVFLFVAALALMIYVWISVQNIQAQKETGFDSSKQVVFDKTDISVIHEMTVFHEATSYHIVHGSTEDGEGKVAFIPLDDDHEVTVLHEDKLKSKQSIQQQWEQSCDACKLIRIQPAMIKSTPLWELAYQDENGRYVLDYKTMADGQQYEQMRLKQRFK